SHRRPRLPRRRWLPAPRRADQGADQSRRRKNLSARDRRGAARASRRRRSGQLRHAARHLGRRSRRRRRRPAGGERGRADRVLPHAPGRVQEAEADSHHRRHSAHGDRQGAAGRRRPNLQTASLVRFAIAGAGAIGGYIGAKLAKAGADVVLFARGPHLEAMQQRGLRVVSARGDFEGRPKATGALDDLAGADGIVLCVQAHGLTTLAPQLRPRFGADTVVVSTQNGIPWWYFQNHPGELNGLTLERVVPGGVIARAIEPERVIGSLAYFSTDIAAPGVIHHTEGNR